MCGQHVISLDSKQPLASYGKGTVPEAAGLHEQVHAGERMHAVLAMARERDMQIPLLLKPLPACCLPGAHDFVLVESQAGSADFVQDSIVQQFIPHNGIVHKVFVVGSQVSTCSRILQACSRAVGVSMRYSGHTCQVRLRTGPIPVYLFLWCRCMSMSKIRQIA